VDKRMMEGVNSSTYIVRTSVKVTVYPQYKNNMIIKLAYYKQKKINKSKFKKKKRMHLIESHGNLVLFKDETWHTWQHFVP
jgi:hypothetical protein